MAVLNFRHLCKRKNKVDKVFVFILIMLIMWGILAFFGIGDLIFPVKIQYIEGKLINNTQDIEYMILTKFKTEGDFIAGKPIDVYVEITKISGNKFTSDENKIFIGDQNTFMYPKKIDEKGFFNNAIIKLEKNEEGNKLIGSGTVIFDQPGKLPLYTQIIDTDFSKIPDISIGKSSNSIQIAERQTWLLILQNRRIFALTLILLAFTFYQVFK